jgi:putative tryptophan/tyrosine transport system substrate-binding protein
MRRREFFLALGSAAAAWPLAARAQPADRMRHVGILIPYAENDPEYQIQLQAFRDTLREKGWIEGKTIHFTEHWTTDNMDRIRTSAASLVDAKPDVIVAIGGRVIPVFMQMSQTIPLVIPGISDPVGLGLVQSLAHPGGNITGFTFLELSIFGKMLEILKTIAPKNSRAGMIYNSDNPNTVLFRRMFESAAHELAIEPVAVSVHGLADIEAAIIGFAERRDTSVFVPPDITLQALRKEIVELVSRHRLTAIYPQIAYVKAGGLVCYAVDRVDLWRRGADYVDRILRGEKPGDLPFQQPTSYRLVFNLKTARALDIQIPNTLLAVADEVIE